MRPLRILIVDDSPVARSVLAQMIAPHPAFQVVAAAPGIAEALTLLEATPADIVLLDLEMPGLSGLQGLPRIVAAGARVLVVSSACEQGTQARSEALALGAAGTLAKPGVNQSAACFSTALVEQLAKIGGLPGPPAAGLCAVASSPGRRAVECLLLGGSTGGLHAATSFLRAIAADFDPPILVTQHLPSAFMACFARQLGAAARRPAMVATDGLPLRRGSIVVAPGDAHLVAVRDGAELVARLDGEPTPGGYRPSVDRMIEAAARVYGSAAVAVIFSGMGRDGAAGARALRDKGGSVYVQDRDTSAVWGMPRAVAEAGLASAALPPARLAALVAAQGSVSQQEIGGPGRALRKRSLAEAPPRPGEFQRAAS